MKDPYKVVFHPLRTEKGIQEQTDNKYIFTVDTRANKIDIKRAVQEIYKVSVVSVNTMNMLGKQRRVRLVSGKRPDWKKAIVTLKQGETIEIK